MCFYLPFSLSLGRPSSRNNNNNNNSNNNNNNNNNSNCGLESFNLNSIVSSQQHQHQQLRQSNSSDSNVTFSEQVLTPLTTPELSPFDNSFGGSSSNASVSLPSPFGYDGFDDPLTGSRHSFRGSLSDCDGIIPSFCLPEVNSEHTFTFSEIQR